MVKIKFMWLQWCIYTCWGPISGAKIAATGVDANNNDRQVVFNHCALFANCNNKISNTQIYNAKDIDAVMPIYDLIEYSEGHSKHLKVCSNAVEMNQL